MNKHDIAKQVADATGESVAVCEKVIDAFEKAMQRKLSSFGSVGEAFGKIGVVISRLFGGDKRT